MPGTPGGDLLPLSPTEPSSPRSLTGVGQEQLWSHPLPQRNWGQWGVVAAAEKGRNGTRGDVPLSMKGRGWGEKSSGIHPCFGT